MSLVWQNIDAIKIFFSYSHEDSELRDALEKHLNVLKRQGYALTWHDRNISAGKEWAHEIDTHLDTADIVLLLVSSDFMESDYCYEIEMKRALQRHERDETCVIPVLLRPIYWKDAPFNKLQVLPKNGTPVTRWLDRDEAFENITKGILEIIRARSLSKTTVQKEKKLIQDKGEQLLAMRSGIHSLRFMNRQGGQFAFPGQLKDEDLRLLVRKHWFFLVRPALPMLVTLLAFWVTVMLVVFSPALRTLTSFLIESAFFITFLGTTIWFITSTLLHWWFDVYMVTDKRFIYMSGFLQSIRQEHPVAQIQQVGIDIETPWGLLLGFGTVIIYLTRGTFVIKDTLYPKRVKDAIIGLYEELNTKKALDKEKIITDQSD
jgi:hypothetical protein